MTGRRVGVEEELILSDLATGTMRPVARELLARCGPADGGSPGAEIKHEFFLAQVEVATRPHTDVGAIRDELARARSRIADVGATMGVAPLAVPGPVLEASTGEAISPGDRYLAIQRHYGQVARQSLMCALHVHVEVADDEEGVAVIDRVRPWIPALVAMSANSPFWHGQETGYASWRSRVWNMWPTSGPAERFGSADGYRAAVQSMVARGTALDPGLVNLDVRLSHRYPTVEFRVADVCTELDDSVLVAALARALVSHCADHPDAAADEWRVEELRGAAWRAARFGLTDTLVSPLTRELLPAAEVLEQLVVTVAEALETAGDTALARRGLAALTSRGTGARRQRDVLAAQGDLTSVVADIRDRTLQA